MNYSKPEANTLGQAKVVIEGQPTIKPPSTVFDGGLPKHVPAYDLDE